MIDSGAWYSMLSHATMTLETPSDVSHFTLGRIYVNAVPVRALFDSGAAASFLARSAAERAGIKIDGPGSNRPDT